MGHGTESPDAVSPRPQLLPGAPLAPLFSQVHTLENEVSASYSPAFPSSKSLRWALFSSCPAACHTHLAHGSIPGLHLPLFIPPSPANSRPASLVCTSPPDELSRKAALFKPRRHLVNKYLSKGLPRPKNQVVCFKRELDANCGPNLKHSLTPLSLALKPSPCPQARSTNGSSPFPQAQFLSSRARCPSPSKFHPL